MDGKAIHHMRPRHKNGHQDKSLIEVSTKLVRRACYRSLDAFRLYTILVWHKTSPSENVSNLLQLI